MYKLGCLYRNYFNVNSFILLLHARQIFLQTCYFFLLWFHNPDALLVDNGLVDNGF